LTDLSCWRNHAELLHEAQGILFASFFNDLAVSDAVNGHTGPCQLLASWRYAQKHTLVCTMHRPTHYHFVTFSDPSKLSIVASGTAERALIRCCLNASGP